jgi:hypothetical protein
MNDDYLWDKTGEPDPQIQELEEILGTLRHKPQPLAIPADLLVTRRRSYRPLVAIAAALLFAVLAVGLWLSFQRNDVAVPYNTKVEERKTSPATPDSPKDGNESAAPTPRLVETPARKQNALTASHKPRRVVVPKVDRRDEEAREAKAQLMIAFRLASEKLSLVQRKTQPPSQIRNQHKVG